MLPPSLSRSNTPWRCSALRGRIVFLTHRQSQAGHREPQSTRHRSPFWDGLGLEEHIRCDACTLFAAPEHQKLPTESCWRHLKNNLYLVVKAGVPVGWLNRHAFAELKPEFPGETAKLSPFHKRGESRSKRRSPVTQPYRNTAALLSKAAPQARPLQNHLPPRVLGKMLPCRHPASTGMQSCCSLLSHSIAGAAAAFADLARAEMRCWGGNSWTRHRLSPSLTDTQPARLPLPSSHFIWPQMSRPCAPPAMP